MGTNPRILLISREGEEATVRALLAAGYDVEVRRAATRMAFREIVSAARWDGVLFAFTRGNLGPVEAQRALSAAGTDIPFLILCSSTLEAEASKVLGKGIRSYVVRGSSTLAADVGRELRQAALRREQRTALGQDLEETVGEPREPVAREEHAPMATEERQGRSPPS